MELFALTQRRLWGDLGTVLIAGYYDRRTDDGPMLLERTGPFVPPFSVPWNSVYGPRPLVSSRFRTTLMDNGFAELDFRATTKKKIAKSNWHEWDLAASNPRQFPVNGEPENYVWAPWHSWLTAWRMEQIWELLVPVVDAKYRPVDPNNEDSPNEAVFPKLVKFPRWFRTRKEWGDVVVDRDVRTWLESSIPEWVRFDPLRYTIA